MRTSRLDFSGARNIINPEAELAKTFGQTGSTLDKMIAQSAQKKRDEEALKQQALRNQMDREGLDLRKQGLTLQEQEAIRRAEDAERLNALKVAELQQQFEQNMATRENMAKQLGIQEQGVINAEAQRRYERNKELGYAAGTNLNIDTQTPVEETVLQPVEGAQTKAAAEAERLNNMVGLSDQEKNAMWLQYAKENNLAAYDYETGPNTRVGGVFKDSPPSRYKNLPNEMLAPVGAKIGPYGSIIPLEKKDTLSEALFGKRRSEVTPEPVAKEKPMTREQYIKSLNDSEAQVKKDVEEFVKTDKDYGKEIGLMKEVVKTSYKRKSESELKQEFNASIMDYAKKNKLSMNSPQIVGLYKYANDAITAAGIKRESEIAAARELTTFAAKEDYKNMSRLNREKELRRIESALESASGAYALDLKERKLRIDKLQKELDD